MFRGIPVNNILMRSGNPSMRGSMGAEEERKKMQC